MAHDFNNLLTAILGYSALIAESARDQPELLSDLEEIKKAGERAALTRQLLTFSRKQVRAARDRGPNAVVAQVERCCTA